MVVGSFQTHEAAHGYGLKVVEEAGKYDINDLVVDFQELTSSEVDPAEIPERLLSVLSEQVDDDEEDPDAEVDY